VQVVTLYSVDRASLYNLVNETSLLHYLFLVHFVSFVYNLYILHTRQSAIPNNKYQMSQNRVVSPDDGPGEGRKMYRL